MTGGGVKENVSSPVETAPEQHVDAISSPKAKMGIGGQLLQEHKGVTADGIIPTKTPRDGPETSECSSEDHATTLGNQPLCFRPRPIGHLVTKTLRRIDPSGVFSTYQQWADVKNRVLSSEKPHTVLNHCIPKMPPKLPTVTAIPCKYGRVRTT